MAKTIFVKASDILKEKGYKPPKFNTELFFEAVSAFFRAHETTARLTLFPASMTLKSGFKDEEITNGFAFRSKEDIERALLTVGLPPPKSGLDIVYVDRSFLKNAAAMLSIMCGFIVERERVNGKSAYVVSLV